MPSKKGEGAGTNDMFVFFLPKVGDLPVAYLCGQESFCREVGSREALARAKRNVEQAYPVVGVIEQLDATLVVYAGILAVVLVAIDVALQQV